MAYPAMLTKVPNGWLGVVAASMMGALFSTVAAHLNLGSAYLVNDFWKRFARPRGIASRFSSAERRCSCFFCSAAGLRRT